MNIYFDVRNQPAVFLWFPMLHKRLQNYNIIFFPGLEFWDWCPVFLQSIFPWDGRQCWNDSRDFVVLGIFYKQLRRSRKPWNHHGPRVLTRRSQTYVRAWKLNNGGMETKLWGHLNWIVGCGNRIMEVWTPNYEGMQTELSGHRNRIMEL